MRFNKFLDDIRVYEAGKPIELVVREFGIAPEDVIKLASNENPIGTNPAVAEVIKANAKKAHLYPDDSMYELKEALSERFGVGGEQIIIGAGSDQILEFISRAKLGENSSVLMSRVTFAMYEIYAKQVGAKIFRTPSWEHKPEEFISAMAEYRPDIVYLCTPNNPTGDAITREDVMKIVEAADPETLIVIDGAYMEYAAAKNPAYLIEPKDILKYPNVIYLGTFSKAYGLGGMRVGYGIANIEVIHALYKMRPPFNISTLSLSAAIEAARDNDFVEKTLALHKEQIKRYEIFAHENSLRYIDSYTNFITYLLDGGMDSNDVSDRLLRHGIIVRNLASYGLNAIRITVGTHEQNSRLFEKLKEVLQ
jgi:histidinol-phosphate aminotransferase